MAVWFCKWCKCNVALPHHGCPNKPKKVIPLPMSKEEIRNIRLREVRQNIMVGQLCSWFGLFFMAVIFMLGVFMEDLNWTAWWFAFGLTLCIAGFGAFCFDQADRMLGKSCMLGIKRKED